MGAKEETGGYKLEPLIDRGLPPLWWEGCQDSVIH